MIRRLEGRIYCWLVAVASPCYLQRRLYDLLLYLVKCRKIQTSLDDIKLQRKVSWTFYSTCKLVKKVRHQFTDHENRCTKTVNAKKYIGIWHFISSSHLCAPAQSSYWQPNELTIYHIIVKKSLILPYIYLCFKMCLVLLGYPLLFHPQLFFTIKVPSSGM